MSKSPVKAIRKKCLDCCAGSIKAIKYCPSYECTLWPYRFGMRRSTAIKKFGVKFLDYELMPEDTINLQELP